MLIDRGHTSWAVGTGLATLAAGGAFAWYARTWPGGASAASWPGLVFGVLATLAMAFCGALTVRKKLVWLPLWSVKWWLRGHLWIGLASVPLVLFHAAFRWGGMLEQLLWLLTAVIVGSGILGLLLQNVLPRIMKTELPGEVVQDQLSHACHALRQQADEQVARFDQPEAGKPLPPEAARAALREFYQQQVRPYLAWPYNPHSPLHDAARAEGVFGDQRRPLPAELRGVVNKLEKICTRRRQLHLQQRLHFWLHGWLLVHVPLSYVLLILVALHIVTAVYY